MLMGTPHPGSPWWSPPQPGTFSCWALPKRDPLGGRFGFAAGRKRGVCREGGIRLYTPGQRGGGASAHKHRLWSVPCSQSLRTGLGEAASFPARFIDDSFRGRTNITVLGQDLRGVCLTPSPCPLRLPGATFQQVPRVYTLRVMGAFLSFSSTEAPRFGPRSGNNQTVPLR